MGCRGHASGIERLVVLMGGNPLPNYLSARMRQPRSVDIIHSQQGASRSAAERLADLLAEETHCEYFEIADEGSTVLPDGVARRLAELPPHSELHYTGGTKQMAVSAALAVAEQRGVTTAYLDPHYQESGQRAPSLRFSPCGCTQAVAVEIPAEVLAHLHRVAVAFPQETAEPLVATARAVAACVLAGEHGQASAKFREQLQRLGDRIDATIRTRPEARGAGFAIMRTWRGADARETARQAAHELFQALRTSGIPVPDEIPDSVDELAAWSHLARNGWLEQVSAALLSAVLAPEVAPLSSTRFVRDSRPRRSSTGLTDFEVDVVVSHQSVLFVLSCTASATKRAVRQKALEVAVRARQLGGDHARPAVVSLASGEVARHVTTEFARSLPSWMSVRVFGSDDLQQWLDGDLESLREWTRDA